MSEALKRQDEDRVAQIALRGVLLEAHPAGALYWPEEGALIVSDVHLEKGSAFAARGVPLPPYDSGASLARLETLCARFSPGVVISLGDAFHDARAGARMAEADRARLEALTQRYAFVWIEGNHDPEPPEFVRGERVREWARGPLTFRHEPSEGPAPGEVAGHLHPAAVVPTRARRMRRRCFVSDGERLLMPAFGAYTGGLEVLEPAIAGLFPGAFIAWVLGRTQVHPIADSQLLLTRNPGWTLRPLSAR